MYDKNQKNLFLSCLVKIIQGKKPVLVSGGLPQGPEQQWAHVLPGGYEVWVGTEISQVTAQDPDSEVFGSESIKYEQKDDTITPQNLFHPK